MNLALSGFEVAIMFHAHWKSRNTSLFPSRHKKLSILSPPASIIRRRVNTRHGAYASYAYRIRFNKSQLSVGLQRSLTQYQTD